MTPRKHTHCTVDGCGRLHRARGLCTMHYHKARDAKALPAGVPRAERQRSAHRSCSGACRAITVRRVRKSSRVKPSSRRRSKRATTLNES